MTNWTRSRGSHNIRYLLYARLGSLTDSHLRRHPALRSSPASVCAPPRMHLLDQVQAGRASFRQAATGAAATASRPGCQQCDSILCNFHLGSFPSRWLPIPLLARRELEQCIMNGKMHWSVGRTAFKGTFELLGTPKGFEIVSLSQ